MRLDSSADYTHKDDLLRNQLSLVIHEAARLEPVSPYPVVATNAAERIPTLFLTLLEVPFSVTQRYHEPILKNAQEFADWLAVHVNHLNRAVKEVTGKPTTAYLADRYLSEANVLLQQTDWNVSEIADSLGFEYATYFQRFFKKHTGTTPLGWRSATRRS
jgi:AraC family transcriptional activator of pobA